MYDNIIKIYELEHLRNRIIKMDSITKNNEVILNITLSKKSYRCTYCSSGRIVVKDYVNKLIKHQLSMTKKVFINYRNRRYKCKFCNKTFLEPNPFISTNKTISTLTVMNVLEYLKNPNHTFKSAGDSFNLSTNTVIDIFDKHVKPKRKKLPRVLCIDEVHIKTYSKYPYACVLLDFDKNEIVDVLKTRHKSYLRSYFERLSISELDSVKYVVMDLWSTYKDIVLEYMPKAKIVADAFHVVSHINKILDKKRINVMNKFLNELNPNLNYSNDFGYLLKKFSWLIRQNPRNVKGRYLYVYKYKMNVYSLDLLKHLLNSDPELKEIYNLRNVYFNFNKGTTISEASDKLLELISIFRNHPIIEIRDYGRMLARWKNEVINSFNTYNGTRYSNAKLESKNRDIKPIIRAAYGYKRFERFRARVIYSLNKDTPLNL